MVPTIELRSSSSSIRDIFCIVALFVFTLAPVLGSAASTELPDVLVEVNGDSITSEDLDQLLVQTHRSLVGDAKGNFDYRKLLEQLVNNELLLQEARMVGLESEPAFAKDLQERYEEDAMRAFVRATFESPEPVSDERIREQFEEYYWRILIRQVSVRTEEEAIQVRDQILAGASMDSLARAISLDTRKIEGGLHNFKYWADVENHLRDVAKTLPLGTLSEPFAFREAYGLIRIEKEAPADFGEFERFESTIRVELDAKEKEQTWSAFIADLRSSAPLQIHDDVLARVASDSTEIFGREFLEGSDDVAISVGKYTMTESDLRRELSHAAMKVGTMTFASSMEQALNRQIEKFSLLYFTDSKGYFDDPEVLAKQTAREERSLIDSYLGEVIASQITFNRAEFEEYYDQNQDLFRDEPKYKLGTITLIDRAEAEEVAARLQGGADFDYIRKQHGHHGSAEAAGDANWVAIGMFSEEIKREIAPLEPGQSSRAIDTAAGHIIFYVRDKSVDAVKPLESVEMEIREAMFQKKFDAALDEYLALLKERSEIVRHEEQIEAYFSGTN